VHIPAFSDLQRRRAPVGPAFALLGAGWLSACAQNAVKVESAWPDGVPRNQTFTRVLVVGASPDIDTRCAFEWALVAQLKSSIVQAVASCDAMSLKDPLTRETVERAVESLQADSVLATSLVALKFGAQEGGGRDTRGAGYYKATGSGYESGLYGGYYGGYGAYDVPVVYGEYQTAPSIKTVTGEAQVSTRLYEARGKTLVYQLSTKVKARDLESRASGLAILTAPIADRLRREGLIH
jgi:hypothetical protein